MATSRGSYCRVGASLVAVLAFGVSACSESEERPAGAEASEPIALTALFGFVHTDYEPVDNPVELNSASFTDLSLTGAVAGWALGPKSSQAETERSGRKVIMIVEVDRVLKGESSGDHVSVLLPRGPRELDDFRDSLRIGSPVTMYLNIVDRADVVGDMAAGPLYVPVTPQGFIVGDADGSGVTYPLEHRQESAVKLSAVTPR